MLPLYEMLARAQDGQAMETLARQFDLSQQQARTAVEALLPAFSQGLKHNAADPYGFGAFLGALSTGRHAKYFENAQAAFTPGGVAEGNDILGHLFGSKDLSRAVAAQAAQATGIGQDVLRQMLPAIAAMIMGGLFKQTTGQMAGQSGAGAVNPLGEMIAGMMRQGADMVDGGAGATPRAPDLMDNPLARMARDMMAGMAPRAEPKPDATPAENPFLDNPFARMFEEMMKAGQPSAEPPEPKNPSGRPRTPYDDLFGEMFETGARQRDEYVKGMESVFDQFLKGMDRRG